MTARVTLAALKFWLRYDAETGLFTWIQRPAIQISVGDIAGCTNPDGYVVIGLLGNLYRANRLAWFYMTGSWPGELIDHKDTNKANNAWRNLRLATYQQNNCNIPTRSDNTSGVKGVSWNKHARKWTAQVSVCGKKIHLGVFSDLGEAARAAIAARNEMHAGFANHG